MTDSSAIVRSVYDAFAAGDVPGVLGVLAPDIRWTEALGGPYGGVYVGPEAVVENVFMRLAGEWDGFAAVPRAFVGEGETVVVIGDYSATHKGTGRSFTAPFAHVWSIEGGRAVAFEQITDTHVHREPMS